MENCINDCIGVIPARYDDGNCDPVKRAYGYKKWAALKCGIEFADILDPLEWETKISAGDVILSPHFGTLEFGDTTTDILQDGCGMEYDEFSEKTWTYSTFSVKKDYSDEEYWYEFKKNARGYTFIYFNCEDRVYLPDENIKLVRAAASGAAVPMSNVGFKMSITKKPEFVEGPNGKGKSGIWKVEGKFVVDQVERSIEIPGIGALI